MKGSPLVQFLNKNLFRWMKQVWIKIQDLITVPPDVTDPHSAQVRSLSPWLKYTVSQDSICHCIHVLSVPHPTPELLIGNIYIIYHVKKLVIIKNNSGILVLYPHPPRGLLGELATSVSFFGSLSPSQSSKLCHCPQNFCPDSEVLELGWRSVQRCFHAN